MDKIALNAKIRTTKGNSPARALRREGRVPAVLYGPNTEPTMISIDANEVETIIKRGGLGRSIFNLSLDDGKKETMVMIKELQSHPVSREVLHVDFYEVSMDRKVWVLVPVVTTGKSIGVENGGMLQIIRRELEVACRPDAIPASITIDISDLDVGDAVHVADIATPENVEIPHDVNFTVLTVVSTKREGAEADEGEGEGAEGEAAVAAGEEE